MPVGITDLAHSLRKNTAGTAVPIPLSRGQQLVAAALGHKSLASHQAAQAAGAEPRTLDGVRNVVPDYAMLNLRAQELGIPSAALPSLVEAAFKERLPRTRVHGSFFKFAMKIQEDVQQAVMNDGDVNAEMANTNYDGIDEVYLEDELDPELATLDEPLRATIHGHVSLGVDTERPYSGHEVKFEVTVVVARCGRCCFEAVDAEVVSAGLDYNWGGDEPATKTLAEALAEALNIEVAEARELADVEPTELSGQSGEMTYGYHFDFARHASPELAAKLMAQHGSLQLEVQPWFFDGIIGADRRN